MPSVIFSNMHSRVFDSFCVLFNNIGWKVYIPSIKENNYFGYGNSTLPTKGEYTELIYKEFLDIKPDVVLCLCSEQLQTCIKLASYINTKLVLRAGNNNINYNDSHSDYLLSNDIQTYKNSNIKHKLFFYLPPDYSLYTKQNWLSHSNIVTTYINYYQKYWKDSWKIYDNIRLSNRNTAFINFGSYTNSDGYSPYLSKTTDLINTLSISRCVLHIKESEGYGWSLLEALACGIPVIVSRQYIKNKTCFDFLIEGKTALFIDNNNIDGFKTVFNDICALQKIADTSSVFIRDFINTEEQYIKVKSFMEDIVLK